MAHGDRAASFRNSRRDAYTRRSGTTKTDGWHINRQAKKRASKVDRATARKLTNAEVRAASRE